MTTAIHPLEFQWAGGVMMPTSPTRAERQYVVGERYWLEPHAPRSRKSHSHFFACVHQAWLNLPEDMAARFPTSDHLRKWCLIKAGYREERTFVCKAKTEAVALAAFIRPMDDYAVVVVQERAVVVMTAKSQSMAAMGRKTFQESKTACLDALSQLIGISTDDLKRNARSAT